VGAGIAAECLSVEPLGAVQPGLLILSYPPGSPPAFDAVGVARGEAADVLSVDEPGVAIASWGLGEGLNRPGRAVLLGRVNRQHEVDLSSDVVISMMRQQDLTGLRRLLPPFAAVAREADGRVLAVTDHMGFRQMYVATGDQWAAMSTSARLLARLAGRGIDREAVGVQSLLGWQLGQRTLFAGVRKLDPGESVELMAGSVVNRHFPPPSDDTHDDVDGAVNRAAAMLRVYLPAFLDDHPDAVLQLTGGQDSRLLLSAIPITRRKGLKIMTLGMPGDSDVEIAAGLARRYGMVHQVHWFDGLDSLPPARAYALSCRAAARLDCMADPIAFAALSWAEASFDQGPRLSGLGGEVARGFYYLGSTKTVPVTRSRAARLAAWRMFANESVEADALDPEFAEWAHDFANGEVFAALSQNGLDWLSATDELYLRHRMQRWAGVTDTAVCFDREVVNPMLDDRFLDTADALPPRYKHAGLFLSRLQLQLDPELAMVPLDGRPPPHVYARRSLGNTARLSAVTAAKFARKARQRLTQSHRPPAGGPVLAAKVVEHWRNNPNELSAVKNVGVVRQSWLDEVLSSKRQPEPSTVALLVNLAVAGEAASFAA
jgi:asparagine synthase (glutamine-hydrolysing)